jgi:2-isopropylmalate synthase
MQNSPITKYRHFPQVNLPDRQWPNKRIETAPVWCSVDLRDGNQALAIPMGLEEKTEFFQMLVKMGFKQIEVGFPSASDTEFAFCRKLIEEKLIPDDVSIQVLVQCREHLIRRTFEAIDGAPNAIVHFYNSTNPLQRRVTFGMSKEEIKEIAREGAKLVKELGDQVQGTNLMYEYSPESFSDTEVDYAIEVCEVVMDEIRPTPENKMILNLPNTVEVCSANIHADQIEYFCRNVKKRDSVLISLHTHNDRGTGVAATEFGLMAGADRVEGTLFGNGERTGNLDIVCVALNMYSQGVHPELDLSDIPEIRSVYERCTRMRVPERQPYGGDLVFTAFSGSHQDAIKKGMDKMDTTPGALWQVPYLPIDPEDIGCNYEAIIRINSQSGKGGVAYVMEHTYGFCLPKQMHPEFGLVTTAKADELGDELSPEQIKEVFYKEYIFRNAPLSINSYKVKTGEDDHRHIHIKAKVVYKGKETIIKGSGNGPINAFVDAIKNAGWKEFRLMNYSQHALTSGSSAEAATYIQVERINDHQKFWGVSIESNIELAGIKALISAFNRAARS